MTWVTQEYPKYPNFGSGRVQSGPFHVQVPQVQNSEYPKERGRAGYQILQVFSHGPGTIQKRGNGAYVEASLHNWLVYKLTS